MDDCLCSFYNVNRFLKESVINNVRRTELRIGGVTFETDASMGIDDDCTAFGYANGSMQLGKQ